MAQYLKSGSPSGPREFALKFFLITLLLASLSVAVWAAPPRVGQETVLMETIIFTDPPGAAVSHQMSGGPEYIGVSNLPIMVNSVPFRRENSSDWDSNAILTIKLEGHRTIDVTVSPTELFEKNRRFPASGYVVLEPENARVAFTDMLRRYRLPLAALSIIGVPGGVMLWRREKRRRAFIARTRTLDEYRAANREDSWLGSLFTGYRVIRKIGAGGMSTVYLGVPDDTLDERQAVAIKILKLEDEAEQEEFIQRYRREVQMSQKLQHAHIVRLIDWRDGDPCGLVMEFIDGKTLREHIPRDGMRFSEFLQYARPILSALAYAHTFDILHRDLKPENIMVREDGMVKVMDFGLARTRQVSVKVTQTGTALGTPAYMAPEQIAGRPVLASDQYSLGLVFFELLTGRRPFEDGDMMMTLLQHISEEPVPLSRYKPLLKETVEPVLARMMAKAADERYDSLAEVLDRLEALVKPLSQRRGV